MKKILFLDRDGVINREIGDYVKRPEDLEILPHALLGCKKAVDMGYDLVVITNQGGIAKGLYTHQILGQIHQKMKDVFQNEGLEFLEIYYSPHHDSISASLSRKPGSLMIEKALARFQANPKQCLMVGDSDRDIIAAENAGVKGLKIDSNTDWNELIDPYLS